MECPIGVKVRHAGERGLLGCLERVQELQDGLVPLAQKDVVGVRGGLLRAHGGMKPANHHHCIGLLANLVGNLVAARCGERERPDEHDVGIKAVIPAHLRDGLAVHERVGDAAVHDGGERHETDGRVADVAVVHEQVQRRASVRWCPRLDEPHLTDVHTPQLPNTRTHLRRLYRSIAHDADSVPSADYETPYRAMEFFRPSTFQ